METNSCIDVTRPLQSCIELKVLHIAINYGQMKTKCDLVSMCWLSVHAYISTTEFLYKETLSLLELALLQLVNLLQHHQKGSHQDLPVEHLKGKFCHEHPLFHYLNVIQLEIQSQIGPVGEQ